MKKIKILSLILLLPIIAAMILSCSNNVQGEVTGEGDEHEGHGHAQTYFQTQINAEHPFVEGHVVVSPKDPNAELTVEDFPELECESVTFLYKTEAGAYWLIVLKTQAEDETVVAIDKLTYRSDLNFAEPNYVYTEE
ncbi:MAG: hypothetical protein IJY97_05800 [Clostridia bacterium]|nr:hypothetical protein [Clostridia bacterium]